MATLAATGIGRVAALSQLIVSGEPVEPVERGQERLFSIDGRTRVIMSFCEVQRRVRLSSSYYQQRFIMPTILISGPAHAFAGNPRGTDPVTDRKTLARFHGLVSEEACADLLDAPSLNEIGITGGRLRFVLEQ